MIARLALIETKTAFSLRKVDIHRRMDQFEPAYVRINPHMTVPALVTAGGILADSSDVLRFAFGGGSYSAQTEEAVARHYRFAIDELTFSWLLGWNPVARHLVPGKLAGARDRLAALATANPDLGDLYRQRHDVFAARVVTFDPHAIAALHKARWANAQAELQWLETLLADGRPYLDGATYGPADVVWTVFLARMHFIGEAGAVKRLPALARYDAAMQSRPSFDAADVWLSLNPIKFIKQLF